MEGLFHLKDEAGVHAPRVVDLDGLAAVLHSWYISPDDPDIVDEPDLRETILNAHAAVDELVEALRRGKPTKALADFLDVTVKRARDHGGALSNRRCRTRAVKTAACSAPPPVGEARTI